GHLASRDEDYRERQNKTSREAHGHHEKSRAAQPALDTILFNGCIGGDLRRFRYFLDEDKVAGVIETDRVGVTKMANPGGVEVSAAREKHLAQRREYAQRDIGPVHENLHRRVFVDDGGVSALLVGG